MTLDPTGNTDSSATINQMLGSGGTVELGQGVFRVDSPIASTALGGRFKGAGSNMGGTVLRAGTPGMPYVLAASAEEVEASGFIIDGAGNAVNGLVFHNAANGLWRRIQVTNCRSHGVVWNNNAAPKVGNNDNLLIESVISQANGGSGFYTDRTMGADNGAMTIIGLRAIANKSHGLHFCGEGLRVFGGDVESNGGYGIQVSDPDDLSYSVGSQFFACWMEANALGGYRGGGKSIRNVVFGEQGFQGVTNAPGSADTQMFATNGNGLAFRDDSTGVLIETAAPIGSAIGQVYVGGGELWLNSDKRISSRVAHAFPAGALFMSPGGHQFKLVVSDAGVVSTVPA